MNYSLKIYKDIACSVVNFNCSNSDLASTVKESLTDVQKSVTKYICNVSKSGGNYKATTSICDFVVLSGKLRPMQVYNKHVFALICSSFCKLEDKYPGESVLDADILVVYVENITFDEDNWEKVEHILASIDSILKKQELLVSDKYIIIKDKTTDIPVVDAFLKTCWLF